MRKARGQPAPDARLIAWIADGIGISLAEAREAIDALVAAGLAEVVEDKQKGVGISVKPLLDKAEDRGQRHRTRGIGLGRYPVREGTCVRRPVERRIGSYRGQLSRE